jgi:hypothetical protein
MERQVTESFWAGKKRWFPVKTRHSAQAQSAPPIKANTAAATIFMASPRRQEGRRTQAGLEDNGLQVEKYNL